MSYNITCSLIDISELKRICGSKDQKILSSLIDKLEYDLEELDEEYDDYFKNENENAQEILTDIINGEIRFQHLIFLYGYIYQLLCNSNGKEITPPSDEFDVACYWAVTMGVSKTFGFNYQSSNYSPEIYCIENSNLEIERAKFLALTEVEGLEDEYLAIAKQDFNFVFEEAIKANKDLAFFLC